MNLWEISRLILQEITEIQTPVGTKKLATILSTITSTSVILS